MSDGTWWWRWGEGGSGGGWVHKKFIVQQFMFFSAPPLKQPTCRHRERCDTGLGSTMELRSSELSGERILKEMLV